MDSIEQQLAAAVRLRERVDAMRFPPPVTQVYDPLDYAWAPFAAYVRRYGGGRKRVLFLGMNPGPWGMTQTGVPFGEVGMVRDWLGIEAEVQRPAEVSPLRPVDGFACPRSEVSGRRLWGGFASRFGRAENFFADHFVVNYCPLLFSVGARNLTPDKLASAERGPLFQACDTHLCAVVDATGPDWVVGVGRFAAGRARQALAGRALRIGEILHPSPASPAANRGWFAAAERQLVGQGIWTGD